MSQPPAPDHAALLEQALERKTAQVGVIGLGYVGLPLARAFVEVGYRTLGFDIDPDKIAHIKSGGPTIRHIAGGGNASATASGAFEPTADMRRLGEPDVLVICVPTPLSESRQPDLSHVESAARRIAATLRAGQLVVLESTTYPGATREIVLPILNGSGLRAGSDFFLAYSPERQDPGNTRYHTRNIPKVIGGLDLNSRRLTEALYRAVTPRLVPMSNCETAEACKILENTYRAVNIALVNELKIVFDKMGIDIWEVIEAAQTKPFGFQPFFPGPGPGGHCIPIDPYYLTWVARKHGGQARLVELAGEINASVPGYVVERLTAALVGRGKPIRGSRIAVLGVAYKRDVDDSRESPAFALIERLLERGATVTYNDPHVPAVPAMPQFHLPAMTSSPLAPEYLAEQDCVLIVTNHTVYDFEFIVRHAQLIVDTRNATKDVIAGREKIVPG